jgi:uncharacterized protein (DUF952 family)
VTIIYKIASAELWETAGRAGRFDGSPIDLKDGFIHFSAGPQVAETAGRYFTGQDGLVLVAVAAERLGSALRWEPSRNGELFPHLYAPLEFSAVIWVKPMPVGKDGRHVLPDDL